jgi:type IV pilus assembly protein PilA
MSLRNKKGFTLIELLTVIGIIGVLAAIAIPRYNQYKARAYDSDTHSHLHNVFLACKSYWADEGSASDCTVTDISVADYGYTQTTKISIAAGGGEISFNGSATHSDSGNTYTIDSLGSIN